MMPVVIFGDVHGCARQLGVLVEMVREKWSNARLLSVGDLIDRGPDSRGVLDICVREGVEGILGNHELWLGSVLLGHPMNDGPYAKIMGGLATLASYGLSRGDPDHVGAALRATVPKAHQDWILSLPPYRTIEVAGVRYLLVHAGISSGMLEQVIQANPLISGGAVAPFLVRHAPDAFFWVGPRPYAPNEVAQLSPLVQVFGHTPTTSPQFVPGHYAALDTGCGTCPPYLLSALVLHEDGGHEFIGVPTRRTQSA